MDLIFALVQWALLISSSVCRNIDLTEPELAFNHDYVITNLAEKLFVPESSVEVNENHLNELKKRLKVVPFKGNKKWKSKDNKVLGDDFGKNSDVPIAVIFASKDNDIDHKDKDFAERFGKQSNKLPKSNNNTNFNKEIDKNKIVAINENRNTVLNESLVNLNNETITSSDSKATETPVDHKHLEQKEVNGKILKENENSKTTKTENDSNNSSEAKKQVTISADKDLPINELNTFLEGIKVNVSKVDINLPINDVKNNDSAPIDVMNEEVVDIKENYQANVNETRPPNHDNLKSLCKIFNFTEDGLNKHNRVHVNIIFN